MKRLFYFLGIVVAVMACTQQSSKENYESFGAEINSEDVSSLDRLQALLEEQDSVQIKITASVDEVCQMKGCWMTLEADNSDPVRVTFKDYGFFVPKDIQGRDVIISGVATKSVLSEDMAKHYAEDAGTEYDSIKTYKEIAFVADGVLLAAAQE